MEEKPSRPLITVAGGVLVAGAIYAVAGGAFLLMLWTLLKLILWIFGAG